MARTDAELKAGLQRAWKDFRNEVKALKRLAPETLKHKLECCMPDCDANGKLDASVDTRFSGVKKALWMTLSYLAIEEYTNFVEQFSDDNGYVIMCSTCAGRFNAAVRWQIVPMIMEAYNNAHPDNPIDEERAHDIFNSKPLRRPTYRLTDTILRPLAKKEERELAQTAQKTMDEVLKQDTPSSELIAEFIRTGVGGKKPLAG